MMSVLILTTHWADDYWYKSGEAPYTKYLDDVPDFIGDQNFPRGFGGHQVELLHL